MAKNRTWNLCCYMLLHGGHPMYNASCIIRSLYHPLDKIHFKWVTLPTILRVIHYKVLVSDPRSNLFQWWLFYFSRTPYSYLPTLCDSVYELYTREQGMNQQQILRFQTDGGSFKGHFFSYHSTLTNRQDTKTQLSLIFLKIWAFQNYLF